MKFLDISGVTTLWNTIGIKTHYIETSNEQTFATQNEELEAVNALYDELVQLVPEETINNFDKNKINVIVLRGADTQNVIAKIIILQIFDSENKQTLLGFTSFVYGQYSNGNIYASTICLRDDIFKFVPLDNPNNVIER